MILNEEILVLAKTCGFDRHISKATNDIYWECDEEDLLKFALIIHEMGYNEGSYDTSFYMGDENV
jgi:hypothetical protein